MARARAHRTITDDLLAVAVRIKRDAGVAAAELQGVIDRFASPQQWQERTGGIGFPLVEDIPQARREEFLAALAELAPSPDHRGEEPRYVSAAKLWPERIFRD
jgi:hypothetical protein